jgi:hypothetical protein
LPQDDPVSQVHLVRIVCGPQVAAGEHGISTGGAASGTAGCVRHPTSVGTLAAAVLLLPLLVVAWQSLHWPMDTTLLLLLPQLLWVLLI